MSCSAVEDRRQRVAQLVAEHGEELVLGAVGRLGVGARARQLGDLDGDDDDAVDLPASSRMRLIDEVEEALLGRAVGAAVEHASGRSASMNGVAGA